MMNLKNEQTTIIYWTIVQSDYGRYLLDNLSLGDGAKVGQI